MNWTVATDLAYLALALPLTVAVATTLSRNGRVFLDDVLPDQAALAGAVNRLLVVGFYLVNLGFVSLYLRSGGDVHDLQTLLSALSLKIGVVLLVLGVLHFGNTYVFNAIRRRHRLEQLRGAPLAPQGYVAPPSQPVGAYGQEPYPAPGR